MRVSDGVALGARASRPASWPTATVELLTTWLPAGGMPRVPRLRRCLVPKRLHH